MALEGEKTQLRAVEPEDAARFYRWMNDREVTRTLAMRYPMSMAAEREWAERAAAQRQNDVAFAIELRESGEPIGTCGLRGISPENRTAELGVSIGAKQHWGRGYGFDALRTLLRYGFHELNLRRITLTVLETNPRARELYGRLGFVHEGTLRGEMYRQGRALDLHVMGIMREEFDARHGAAQAIVLERALEPPLERGLGQVPDRTPDGRIDAGEEALRVS